MEKVPVRIRRIAILLTLAIVVLYFQNGLDRTGSAAPPLRADFTFAPAKPMVGEMVTFTATASDGTPPYTFSWTFGDGSIGSGDTVTHAYASLGSFSVTVTVIDFDLNTTSAPHSVPVTAALVADFTFTPASPSVGQTVTFTRTASGGTTPYVSSWNFGDGVTGTGQPTVTHVYSRAGFFSVTLDVTDAAGHHVTVVKTVVVTLALTADFIVAPAKPVIGETTYFNATASGGTPPYSYGWTFGDGSIGSGQNVTHAYSSATTFSVTLKVTDSIGVFVTVSKPVPVTPPLTADFTIAPAQPAVAETTYFNATATGGTLPYTYVWTFGDGSGTTGVRVTHTYGSPGSFEVTLRVTDSANHAIIVKKPVSVSSKVVADFAYAPTNPAVGQSISFSATASGGIPPYTFGWDFGDGTTGTGATVTHSYNTPDSFIVTLTVTDSVGHVGKVSKTVVLSGALVADFTFTPAKPAINETVTFTATATGGTTPYTFGWTFGDGTTGSGSPALHAYSSAGFFLVQLTVADSASHSATRTQSVSVSGPVSANFVMDPVYPVTQEQITFSASASGGTPPYTFSWTFGDGSPGSGASVVHSYQSAGTFAVRLTTRDLANHLVNVSKPVAVAPPIVVAFSYVPTNPNADESVSFSGTATGGAPPYVFHWTFGDGSVGEGPNIAHAFSAQGTFTATLTVSDSVGRIGMIEKAVVVAGVLVVDFNVSQTHPIVGEMVVFTATIAGGSSPYAFLWTFGDGSNGSGASVGHAYSIAGAFAVILNISDSSSHEATLTKDVQVTPVLSLAFSFLPTNPAAGQKISFAGNVSGGTPPYAIAWILGDGNTSLELRLNHSYGGAGSFVVVLTVSDSANHDANVTRTIVIAVPVSVDFAFTPSQPVMSETITFVPSVTGGTPPYTYRWTFGDESVSEEARPSHAFGGTGFLALYRVVLETCDSARHCATKSRSIAFQNWPLIVAVLDAAIILAALATWRIRRSRQRLAGRPDTGPASDGITSLLEDGLGRTP